MKLADLLSSEICLEPERLAIAKTIPVTSITSDSRQVSAGSVFFAIQGAKVDATSFIADAFERGAVAVVFAGELKVQSVGQLFPVTDVRRALAFAADRFFLQPSLKLKNIAVTGTSGKTSVTWILAHALQALGAPTFIGGTLGYSLLAGQGSEQKPLQELSNTTMDAISVQSFLAEAVANGAQVSVFENTSQGVVQSRMRHVAWNGAIFTNLSRDHLDLHGSMEGYERAKRELFVSDLAASPKEKKFAILNFDDPAGRRIGEEMRQILPAVKVCSLSFSGGEDIDYLISNLQATTKGLSFVLREIDKEIELSSIMVGGHNAYNIALAAIALRQLGYQTDQISNAVSLVPAVPGRLEPVVNDRTAIYVDYAHKPDALEKVLLFLKPLCRGRLISVFGCGGDRDAGKRAVMGEISTRIADYSIATSDNPRTEDPLAIIEQIEHGVGAENRQKFSVEVDRRKAIFEAVAMAGKDDVILIAGKGHEPYQEIHGVKHPFHDIVVAQEALKASGG